MITCKNAQQLFDRYLDGELSSSLQAELHAHRLNCNHCQQDLAILEACGDVVRMDTRELRLDSSFTNRVMLAYATQSRSPRRRWQRVSMWTAGSLATAASIALAVVMLKPSTTPPNIPSVIASDIVRTSVIAADTVAVPEPVRELLITTEGTQMTDAAKAELDATQQMSSSTVTSLLTPIVERAQRTFTSARRGTEELQMLLQLGMSAAKDSLDATAPTTNAKESSQPSAFDPAVPALDPFGPAFLREPTDSQSSNLPNAL